MCLLAFYHRALADAPILLAANREEFFAREALPPTLLPGAPRILCGRDARAGGTWLGVNEHSLVVAVTNRAKAAPPNSPRSRGLLCLDLLRCRSASEASRLALDQLGTGAYAGVNIVVLDAEAATVIEAGDELRTRPVTPGLHLLTNGDLDDDRDRRQRLARRLFGREAMHTVAQFVETSRRVCATGPQPPEGDTVILRGADRGTVSSTILAITRRPAEMVYLHAATAPDQGDYADYSPALRQLVGAS
jgi:uncharacterized protein with NRDE domain